MDASLDGGGGQGGSRTMGAARKRRGENVSDGNGGQGGQPKRAAYKRREDNEGNSSEAASTKKRSYVSGPYKFIHFEGYYESQMIGLRLPTLC